MVIKLKKIFTSAFIFVFLLACSNEDKNPIVEQLEPEPMEYDFSDRTYEINAEGTGSSTPSPLLIVLHGANSTGQQMVIGTQFNELTVGSNYIVVYPNAFQGLWNFGSECSPAYPDRPDDIEFIKYLIDEVSNDFNVDQNRIYVTGFSMGGFFSFYLARHLSDKIAAFAPVAATMPRFISNGSNIEPVPMLLAIGTSDASVSYDGTGAGNCSSMSAPESIKFWADLSQCDANPTITYLPDNGFVHLNVRVETYNNCGPQNDALFIAVEGGGHRWYVNDEINISQMILDFFKDKSL